MSVLQIIFIKGTPWYILSYLLIAGVYILKPHTPFGHVVLDINVKTVILK